MSHRSWAFRRFVALLLLSAGVPIGFAIGAFVLYRSHPYRELPVFLERHIAIPGFVIDGSKVSVTLCLTNPSCDDVQLEEVETSCGCVSRKDQPGSSRVPLRLGPGQTSELAFVIDTTGRIGDERFAVTALGCTNDGTRWRAGASVDVRIVAGLVAEPPVLLFENLKPGEQQTKSIELLDMLPDPGVTVDNLTSSRPAELSVRLRSTSWEERSYAGSKAKARYVVDVAVIVPPEQRDVFRGEVVVTPAQEGIMPLSVPVVVRPDLPAARRPPKQASG